MSSAATRIVAVIAALVATTMVSSCASSASEDATAPNGASAASAEHNPADNAFARNMMPHHQQALALSAMVPSRSTNPDVLVVAKHISMDQQAEIRTFDGLLAQWGEQSARDNGPGAMPMAGMVDDATMSQLQSLSGAGFDDLWMKSMIAHHQGAVTMAQSEIAQGHSPDAIKMAKMIIAAQQLEIAKMNHLLSASS